MIVAKELLGWAPLGDGFALATDGPEVRLLFLTDDIVRIRASFDGAFPEESYALVMTAWEDRLDPVLGAERRRVEPVAPEVEETPEAVSFSTASLRLVVHRDPFAIEIFDHAGNRLHGDLKGRAFLRDHIGRIFHYVERGREDRYYGFGETAGHLDKAGRRVRLSPKDAIGHDPEHAGCMYKHIPFYIRFDGAARRATGLFYNNFWDGEFEMGSEVSGYWPDYAYYTAEGGTVDLFFINGPGMAEVIERYTDLTGKTVMPPKYALGYLGSTMYYSELPANCDDEIVDFVERNFEEGIPVDGFQLSSGYTVGAENKRYVFTWNEARFPDPEGFFARMAAHGVSVSPNIKPGILLTHPNYGDFDAVGGYIRQADGAGPYVDQWWGGAGSFVDFTNPAGRAAWIALMTRQLIDRGVTSIWNDNCEYEINDRMALCDSDGAPGPAGAVRAHQATLMSRCSHLALAAARPDIRPFVICRSGSAGIQRYAQTWAGDNRTGWETLRFNIATILGMGLSGVANNGCDIGGFQGPSPEAELLVRWVQNGIFQPRFSIHSCNTNNTVTEPWMYADHTHLIRDAIALRYRLIPYLYSLMREASVRGLPILRPLVMEFPDDPALDRIDSAFMLGPSLLVANVLEKGAERLRVRLPAGCDWYDWESRTRHAGGQEIEIPVTLASIPMFLRDGAILPMVEGLTSIARQEIDALHYVIAPRRDARFVLYEDDGVSNACRDGMFRETTVTLTAGPRTEIAFAGRGDYAFPVRSVLLDVINEEKGAFWVALDGVRLPQFLARKKWEAAKAGWIYEAGSASVRIKYPAPEGDHKIAVSFEKFDLIGMQEETEN
ncbi:MAG: TIM-barrel domain-containing protein [Tropicimonas sp.]|uniref:glycoside hydrolase family 31 protein n=1 Tax=Tropicimonas sp. TaxID=2067044 RepID=UPI003A873D28